MSRNSDSDYQEKVDKIGKRLKAARESKGYTQAAMGSLFGMTAQGYAKYEKGNEMKGMMIVKICEILECTPNWLLGASEKDERDTVLHDPNTKDFIKMLESLNKEGQDKVIEYAKDISHSPKYVTKIKPRINHVSNSVVA